MEDKSISWYSLWAISRPKICFYLYGCCYYSYGQFTSICYLLCYYCNVFKYLNFTLDSLSWLFSRIGLRFGPVSYNIILPIGISFYIFHCAIVVDTTVWFQHTLIFVAYTVSSHLCFRELRIKVLGSVQAFIGNLCLLSMEQVDDKLAHEKQREIDNCR